MASVGVWVDIGVSPVFRSLRQDLSEWATPIAVRLFSGDDTPTTSWSGGTPTELDNGDYEPYEVDLTHQNTHISPPPPYWSVFGASFRLGPPEPDNGVIYGWYLGPIDPSSGISFLLAAGRFNPPITIPPAGMTLTIDELRVYLHDCGTVPPPPTPYLLLANFAAPNGTPLNTYVPEVGPVGTTFSDTGIGTFTVEARTAQIASTSHSADGVLWDVGGRDYQMSAYLTVIPAGQDAGLVVRAINGNNHYLVDMDGTLGIVQLYQRVASVYTALASAPLTRGGAGLHYLHVRCDHDTISVVADGADSITYTAGTLFPGATQMGIFSGGEAASSTVQFAGLAVIPL